MSDEHKIEEYDPDNLPPEVGALAEEPKADLPSAPDDDLGDSNTDAGNTASKDDAPSSDA